jgi:hexosaminidase
MSFVKEVSGRLSLRAFLLVCLLPLACSAEVSIIPKPNQLELTPGAFELTARTVIVVSDSQLKPIGNYLNELIKPVAGFSLKTKTSASSESSAIVLQLDSSKRDLGEEGYTLQSTAQSVTIVGAAPAGVFYGVQTLRQLLPEKIESKEKVEGTAWTVPGVRIQDSPRFKWRGYLIDPARHFRSKAEIKRFIDLMALHKLNTLHMHLTDDQGWRIEIKKYPQLTKTGSRIPDYSKKTGNDWYFSQKDMRDLLKYAADRYVTILPEIEMPGHSGAATASYPQLSCDGKTVSEVCVSLESTFEFERNVLHEVMGLFPSQFIHIGGDEVQPDSWRACAACNQQLEKLNKEGLPSDVTPVRVHLTEEAGRPYYEDTSRLQGDFIRRIDAYISSQGKRMIGWDELLEGGLKKDSTARIMIWRTGSAIAAATAQQREVVVSTYPDYYLDNKRIPLQRSYEYEPVPAELPADQEKYITGVQGNMWGEVSTSLERVDWYTFPRLSAIAETGWTNRGGRNFADFSRRLPSLLNRLSLMGVQYDKDQAAGAPPATQ